MGRCTIGVGRRFSMRGRALADGHVRRRNRTRAAISSEEVLGFSRIDMHRSWAPVFNGATPVGPAATAADIFRAASPPRLHRRKCIFCTTGRQERSVPRVLLRETVSRLAAALTPRTTPLADKAAGHLAATAPTSTLAQPSATSAVLLLHSGPHWELSFRFAICLALRIALTNCRFLSTHDPLHRRRQLVPMLELMYCCNAAAINKTRH